MAGHSWVIQMHYVYILQSTKDNRHYIGQTNNVEERVKRHERGEVISTRDRRPLKLLCFKECNDRKEAMRLEKYLKSLKGGNEFKKVLSHWGVAKW